MSSIVRKRIYGINEVSGNRPSSTWEADWEPFDKQRSRELPKGSGNVGTMRGAFVQDTRDAVDRLETLKVVSNGLNNAVKTMSSAATMIGNAFDNTVGNAIDNTFVPYLDGIQATADDFLEEVGLLRKSKVLENNNNCTHIEQLNYGKQKSSQFESKIDVELCQRSPERLGRENWEECWDELIHESLQTTVAERGSSDKNGRGFRTSSQNNTKASSVTKPSHSTLQSMREKRNKLKNRSTSKNKSNINSARIQINDSGKSRLQYNRFELNLKMNDEVNEGVSAPTDTASPIQDITPLTKLSSPLRSKRVMTANADADSNRLCSSSNSVVEDEVTSNSSSPSLQFSPCTQLLLQMESLVQEKGKLKEQNEKLQREVERIHELLYYTTMDVHDDNHVDEHK